MRARQIGIITSHPKVSVVELPATTRIATLKVGRFFCLVGRIPGFSSSNVQGKPTILKRNFQQMRKEQVPFNYFPTMVVLRDGGESH